MVKLYVHGRKKEKRTGIKTGPKPATLKIDGNWRDAIKQSLSKKKPTTGWPKD